MAFKALLLHLSDLNTVLGFAQVSASDKKLGPGNEAIPADIYKTAGMSTTTSNTIQIRFLGVVARGWRRMGGASAGTPFTETLCGCKHAENS